MCAKININIFFLLFFVQFISVKMATKGRPREYPLAAGQSSEFITQLLTILSPLKKKTTRTCNIDNLPQPCVVAIVRLLASFVSHKSFRPAQIIHNRFSKALNALSPGSAAHFSRSKPPDSSGDKFVRFLARQRKKLDQHLLMKIKVSPGTRREK